VIGLLAFQSGPLPRLAAPALVVAGVADFLGVVGIALWASRRTHTPTDFFVAGKGIGIWTLALASMSATLSGVAFIGGPGLVYSLGLGAVFFVLPASLTSSTAAWVLAKRLRLLAEVRGVLTVPDAIGVRYRSPAAQGLSAVAILVAIVGYMATNILALGLVVEAIFGVGLGWGIWLGAGVVLAYSASGGILAGVYTDLFQGTIMAIASTLVFLYALGSGGGFAGVTGPILATDPAFLSPWGKLGPLAALSFFFVFGVGALGQPHVMHKFYMLRDPVRLKWYPLLMTGAMCLTLLLLVSVGLAMKSSVARGAIPALVRPDDAMPRFLMVYAPTVLAGIVFAAVAAAIMSTVNSFLNVGAAAVVHDLPKAFGRVPRRDLRGARIATLLISILAGLVAQFSGMLVAFLGIFGWGLFASTLVPALAIGLNWPGATRTGAIASVMTGLVVTLLFETLAYFRVYSFPTGVTVSGLSLVLSILVFVVVSRLTAHQAGDIDADVRLVMEA
jgi:Na+/proline symporter